MQHHTLGLMVTALLLVGACGETVSTAPEAGRP